MKGSSLLLALAHFLHKQKLGISEGLKPEGLDIWYHVLQGKREMKGTTKVLTLASSFALAYAVNAVTGRGSRFSRQLISSVSRQGELTSWNTIKTK